MTSVAGSATVSRPRTLSWLTSVCQGTALAVGFLLVMTGLAALATYGKPRVLYVGTEFFRDLHHVFATTAPGHVG